MSEKSSDLMERSLSPDQKLFLAGLAFLEDVSEDQTILEDPQNSERVRSVGATLVRHFPQQDIGVVKDFLPIDEMDAHRLYKMITVQSDMLNDMEEQKLNMLGLYAFSYLTFGQIGKIYGLSKQAVHQTVIGRFNIWFHRKHSSRSFMRRSEDLRFFLQSSSPRLRLRR